MIFIFLVLIFYFPRKLLYIYIYVYVYIYWLIKLVILTSSLFSMVLNHLVASSAYLL